MQKISYLPNASRRCGDCGCKKAVQECVARKDPELVVIPTEACGRCGDMVEVNVAILGEPKLGYEPSCDECGELGNHAQCEIELPEGLGTGYARLCIDCIAKVDEGHTALAR